MKPSLAEIRHDPAWYIFDFNIIDRQFSLIHIDETTYRDTSFLDDRVLTPQTSSAMYSLAALKEIFPSATDNSAATKFIFHVGHCGSTLLSRALGASERLLPLREPLSLRNLASCKRGIDFPSSFLSETGYEKLHDSVLESLSRTFRQDQSAVIKMTSICNNLLAPILEGSQDRKSVLLFIPLESYLAAMLRPSAGDGLVLDGRRQAPAAATDCQQLDGAPDLHLADLTHVQLLALAWLMNMHQLCSAASNYPEQTHLLNFEEFLTEPEASLKSICAFFGIDDSFPEISSHFSTVANQYSKRPDRQYSEDTRRQVMEAVRRDKARQIQAGLDWAREMIRSAPILSTCAGYVDQVNRP